MSKIISGNLDLNTYVGGETFDCEVLMSTYNGEKYVECQIESILSQKGVNISLLIRDDGSKDNTVKILKRYQEVYPGKIRIIEGENVGIHKSFASLIENAKGLDYVAFSDQDDRWDNNKLLVGILELRKHSASFYSSAARLVDQDLKDLGMTTANSAKYEYYMCSNSKALTPGSQGCTIILDKQLFNLIRERDYPLSYGHDTWITIIAYLTSNCLYDNQPHMDYRQHSESWTGNRSKRIKQFFIKVKFFVEGMQRYEHIAQDILRRYGDALDANNRNVLMSIAEKDKGMGKRVSALHKLKFGKYGAIENFVYKIYYIFS